MVRPDEPISRSPYLVQIRHFGSLLFNRCFSVFLDLFRSLVVPREHGFAGQQEELAGTDQPMPLKQGTHKSDVNSEELLIVFAQEFMQCSEERRAVSRLYGDKHQQVLQIAQEGVLPELAHDGVHLESGVFEHLIKQVEIPEPAVCVDVAEQEVGEGVRHIGLSP